MLDLANFLIVAVLIGGLIASAVIGGKYERLAAGAFVLCAALTWALQSASTSDNLSSFFAVDLVLGLLLLALFIKSGLKFWLAVAGVAQASMIVASAIRFFGYPLEGEFYLHALNLASFMVQIAIWFGAYEHHRQKRRGSVEPRQAVLA